MVTNWNNCKILPKQLTETGNADIMNEHRSLNCKKGVACTLVCTMSTYPILIRIVIKWRDFCCDI